MLTIFLLTNHNPAISYHVPSTSKTNYHPSHNNSRFTISNNHNPNTHLCLLSRGEKNLANTPPQKSKIKKSHKLTIQKQPKLTTPRTLTRPLPPGLSPRASRATATRTRASAHTGTTRSSTAPCARRSAARRAPTLDPLSPQAASPSTATSSLSASAVTRSPSLRSRPSSRVGLRCLVEL